MHNSQAQSGNHAECIMEIGRHLHGNRQTVSAFCHTLPVLCVFIHSVCSTAFVCVANNIHLTLIVCVFVEHQFTMQSRKGLFSLPHLQILNYRPKPNPKKTTFL